MSPENLDLNTITEARRKSIKATIRPVTLGEMKALGEQLFPFIDHPWRQQFFEFLNQNAAGSFHRATSDDRIEFVYCHDQNKGLWFVPGVGLGPLQENGLKAMKEAVERR